MSSLFCNTEMKIEDIREHMQKHIQKEGLSTHPRRFYWWRVWKQKKMLLSTPLLKWYLDHGLQVTRIYQVVEFNAQACFKNFVNDLTEARRMGDARPDTMKFIGNSGYGSLIMDKTKIGISLMYRENTKPA